MWQETDSLRVPPGPQIESTLTDEKTDSALQGTTAATLIKLLIAAMCVAGATHALAPPGSAGPVETQAVPIRLTDPASNSRGPAWNRRGDVLGFESDARGNWDIYTMRPDGGARTPITSGTGDERHPAWSPDGRRIAYAAAAGENLAIYVMDLRTDAR